MTATPPPPRDPVPRRLFLSLLAVGSASLLCAQSSAALLRFLRPLPPPARVRRLYAGRVGDFPLGSVTRLTAGRSYLARVEGGLLALSQRCTHLGCAVPWLAAEGRFRCACHGSVFNVVGEVTGGPAPRPLDLLPITLDGDAVWVDTARPIQREAFEPEQLTPV